MDNNLRPSGIEGLGDISWGTHFCLFYETKEDLLDFLIPFFKAGLEQHVFCLCVASEPLSAEEAERAMRQAIPDFEHYLAEGQIEITPHTDWYLKDGRFDEGRVLQGWMDKLDHALASGFSGVRFAANILLEQDDWKSFARYEGKLEETLRDLRIEGLCAYDLNRYSAMNMLDVVRHHQFTLARRDGTWQSLEGIQLKVAHEEVLKLNNELEQRVAERIAELATANAQLRREIAERKGAEEAIRKSERVLREAESLGHTGSWDQNLITGEIFNTEENLRLFFGDDRSKGADFEDYAEAVHPDDREYVMQRRAELLDEKGPSDIEYRVVWPDGSVHVIFGRATVVYDESSQPIRVYGTNVDITERKQAEEALRRSESNFRTLADKSLQGIVIYQGSNIVYVNPAHCAIIGYPIEEFKSMSVEQVIALVHPLDRSVAEERTRKRLAGEELSPSVELRVVRKDGATRWLQSFNNPIEYNGQPALLSMSIDITERKQAEEEIKRQATRAETLARIAARLNKQLDLEAVIHAVCEEAVNTFKVSQATMSLYDKKSDLLVYAGGVNIPPKYAAKIEPVSRAQFDEFVRTMGPIFVVPDIQALPNVPNAEFSAELDVRTVVTADLRRDHELIGVLVLGVNGRVREFDEDELTLLKAISDQAAIAVANALLLKAANAQHEQLRALSLKLVEVQETERKAITTELHDRVGQNLTGLSINLQNMKASLSDETAKTLATQFDDVQALLEDTTRQIRDIMVELHPPELEDYGLAVALETYTERAASRGNLELITDLPDLTLSRLPSDFRLALFRAAQEAISNVLKHANAAQLEVSLKEQDGKISLRVQDDGQGFDQNAVSQNGIHSWGLKIMRERIESIGGSVEIESKPGTGTRVTFEIERFS